MLDEVEERLKNPWRQRHLRVRPPQKAFSCVQAEIAEFVNVRRRSIYREFHKISAKFSHILRTFQTGLWETYHKKNGPHSVTVNRNKTRKRTKRKNKNRVKNIPRLSVLRPTRIQRMFRLDFRLSTLFVVAWAVAGQSCRSTQENTQNLTPTTVTAPDAAKTETQRKAEERRKNLEPRPAPQTGSHL
jgi:hypothetical protein